MMFTLNEHIEYLMMHHDCVIIPGLGALVAQYSESFYDADSKLLKRPDRKLGFNSQVNHNDGLLMQSIVRREGLSYDQASRFVDRNVAAFKCQLEAGDEVNMGRLGFFKSDGNNHVEFIPFYHEMCNDRYFGLRSVAFTPLALPESTDSESQAAAVVSPGWWNTRRVWQAAASIAVLLALSVMLTTPIVLNRTSHEMATLNVAEVNAPKQELPAAAAVPHPGHERAEAAERVVEEKSKLLLDEGGNYYLVIASLNSEKQVSEYLASHPDMASHSVVLHGGKYYQVCVARSVEASTLYSLMKTLPTGYQAWVYNKSRKK